MFKVTWVEDYDGCDRLRVKRFDTYEDANDYESGLILAGFETFGVECAGGARLLRSVWED